MWQAEHVRSALQQEHAGLTIELVPITTRGDRIIDRPLAQIGGKGLFIKELEQALFDGRADIAVHSMKDVPAELPPGLHIPVVLKREDPRDALVVNGNHGFDDLPRGATVGTSSLRRKSQLLARRDDLNLSDLRGNVPTRLEKLHQGDFDAIILAAAGLKRLGMAGEISMLFDIEDVIPAVGQGVIGIECRDGDSDTLTLIQPLMDQRTWVCIVAERAMSAYLEGGCDVPMAGHAIIADGQLKIAGLVSSTDGRRVVRDNAVGEIDDGVALGRKLGAALLAAGAGTILEELQHG